MPRREAYVCTPQRLGVRVTPQLGLSGSLPGYSNTIPTYPTKLSPGLLS
jgi:hypothetical protein